MKVLVINGSPKGERSDTLRVTRAFLEGMGEQAEFVQASKLHIEPCLGCYSCWGKTPGQCVHKDDMPALLQKITASDLVIWSFPLYCFGMPAPVKAIVDRMLPLSSPAQEVGENGETYHPAREEHDVRMALISGCGFADREGNFDGLLFQFERMFGGDYARILCVEAPLLNIPEAAPVADAYLALAKRAGEEYARDGRIAEATQAALDAPMYPPEQYRADSNKAW